ncbi:GNAT family N-acetyltransferase [Sphingobium sp. V4]|uniref:GNAT family N-acetyltransferase n=1 Tax=Sphingobium sp. V4 TaxID=3038927 RepID=UPI00255820ED|nr:GNAT family N-acetyltransferase [Sphingobium sp. V4]WIW89576.1 GNAT family N-acetyltransferase [Sphingobium sp. V4]
MADDLPYSWTGRFTDLEPKDQRAVATLVKEGGAIPDSTEQILPRLGRSHRVELLREPGTNRIVGAGMLKAPSANYRYNKFTEAGVTIDGYENASELGYVVVANDMRGQGLGERLVRAVADPLTESCFATTDDPRMHGKLTRAGFSRQGHEWEGARGKLSLWTRPAR